MGDELLWKTGINSVLELGKEEDHLCPEAEKNLWWRRRNKAQEIMR